MKKIMSLLMGVIIAFALAGCGNVQSNPKPSNEPQTLSAPTASVNMETGEVTWTDVQNASGYAYRIDGGDAERVADGQTSVIINAGHSAQIKALGDGVNYLDSEWSNSADYIYSYLLNPYGESTRGINIYTTSGEPVLDTYFGTKDPGDVLKTGVDYIFEFDGTMDNYKSGLLFTGVENAVISDVVWSDCPYDYRDEETSVTDTLKNVKYTDIDTWASFHRVDWGTFWGIGTYGWNYGADAILTDGVYDTTAEGFWTEPANECAQFYDMHWLATAKATNQVTDELVQLLKDKLEDPDETPTLDSLFLRMKINFKSFDSINGPDYGVRVMEGKSIDSLMGRLNFNFFAFFNATHYYAFLDGSVAEPIKGATQSYAVNQDGEKTAGVNIYDKESGELVLDSMTSAGTGNVLESDKDYIFEFKVETKTATPLLMTGLAGATVSEALWTNTLYGDEEQDVEPIRDNLYLAKRAPSKGDSQPLFHFLNWKEDEQSYSCAKEKSVMGKPYDYQWSSDYKCTSFSNMYFYVTENRTDTTQKTYFRMTVRFVSDETKTFCKTGFIHIGASSLVTNPESENYGKFSAIDINMWLFYGDGSYSLYLADAVTPFEPLPDPEPEEGEAA